MERTTETEQFGMARSGAAVVRVEEKEKPLNLSGWVWLAEKKPRQKFIKR
jgi:hypothetical protein